MMLAAMMLGRIRAALFHASATARAGLSGLPWLVGAVATIAVCVLGWRALTLADAYLNPPAPTVTIEAIEAAQQRDRANKLEAAVLAAAEILERRDREVGQAALVEAALVKENARLRGLTVGRATVVLPEDDMWLQAWRRTHP